MKKTLFFFIAIALVTMSFTLSEKTTLDYPDGIDKELAEFLDGEYLSTLENTALRTELEKKFFFLFDEINEIRVQYSEVDGYYYLLIGEDDGISKLELLKIDESDFHNETYSYIDFANIQVNEFTQSCRKSFGPPPTGCPPICDAYDNGCRGFICGVLVGGQCVSQ